jgi:hypothetical protein
VRFGRALRPFAARTCLFRLMNTENGALHDVHVRFGGRYLENIHEKFLFGKNPRTNKAAFVKEKTNKASLMLIYSYVHTEHGFAVLFLHC